MNIEKMIREVKDFPKKGIGFKDITPLLQDSKHFKYAIDELAKQLEGLDIDIVVAPEARGFLVGAPVSYKLGIGFVPIRKLGKLPAETISYEYELEYGTDTLQMHKDAIKPGQRVAIIDDLLATGGTVLATAKLIEQLGGEVVTMNFLIELEFLNARDILRDYSINSIIKY
ncbi:MAG: adenine phosphoribosyltransferase [Clostridiales bacterium]|nr:adenine phosphoribosyltransferase [Clostridiales bacterium]